MKYLTWGNPGLKPLSTTLQKMGEPPSLRGVCGAALDAVHPQPVGRAVTWGAEVLKDA